MIEVQDRTRVEMSQRDREVLKVKQPVLEGQRTQAEAARLLQLSVRQIRRLQRKLEVDGDASLVHGLRGNRWGCSVSGAAGWGMWTTAKWAFTWAM